MSSFKLGKGDLFVALLAIGFIGGVRLLCMFLVWVARMIGRL